MDQLLQTVDLVINKSMGKPVKTVVPDSVMGQPLQELSAQLSTETLAKTVLSSIARPASSSCPPLSADNVRKTFCVSRMGLSRTAK